MTIAEEIAALRGRIDGAYDAIEAKGGTLPETTDSWHLSAAIETIPAREEEEVNGVQSLYAVLPDVSQDGVLSGTLRKGPYHLDLSRMGQIGGGGTQGLHSRSLNGLLGNSLTDYSVLSSYTAAQMREIMGAYPNISSIDIHNIGATYAINGADSFCRNNLNVLSVRTPDSIDLRSNYAFANAFRSTRLPCDMPGVAKFAYKFGYEFDSAWRSAQPQFNPLSSELQERYFPNLREVASNYAFNYAWYRYRPANNFFLDLSALSSACGYYAFYCAI